MGRPTTRWQRRQRFGQRHQEVAERIQSAEGMLRLKVTKANRYRDSRRQKLIGVQKPPSPLSTRRCAASMFVDVEPAAPDLSPCDKLFFC